MYTEEHLEDVYTPDLSIYDEDDGTMSLDSNIKDQRKRTEIIKLLDNCYYKTYRNIDGERVKLEMYSTPILNNSRIRDAITGYRYNHREGSRAEDLYFVMADCTGYGHTASHKETRKLFFQNPEQCERHMGLSLSTDIKETWQRKNLSARAIYYR